MGEVYRPEDLVGGKKKPSDLSPGLDRITPTTLQDVIREIRMLKTEVKKSRCLELTAYLLNSKDFVNKLTGNFSF